MLAGPAARSASAHQSGLYSYALRKDWVSATIISSMGHLREPGTCISVVEASELTRERFVAEYMASGLPLVIQVCRVCVFIDKLHKIN
jgi:hypothetical protein